MNTFWIFFLCYNYLEEVTAVQIIAEEVAMDSPVEKDIKEKSNLEGNEEEDEEQDPDEPVILYKRGN